MNPSNLFIYPSGTPRIDDSQFEVVERKGIGHPDTLCDMLAEKISQAYSQYCLQHYGVILRHMVDKIALSGGAAKVMFGGGEMITPIRLYLNCRFTRNHMQDSIPYLSIVTEVVNKHFGEILPLLDLTKWLTIVDNTHFAPGPGVVYNADGSTNNDRQFFFEIPGEQFVNLHNNGLRSNDTSTAVAYSPLSKTEQIAIFVESTLNGKEFKEKYPYVGTDIKVMIRRIKKHLDVTLCIPFIAKYTPSKEFYFEQLELLRGIIKDLVLSKCGDAGFEVAIYLNTRDTPSKSDYYLTLTGSAIESGDEGVVGRGNRYNGVIPFNRRMSMEACCGKNPVYHVGKLYTAICSLISSEIFNSLGLETYVYLTSQMGRNLSDPWSACVEVCGTPATPEQEQQIQAIVDRHLEESSKTTDMIVSGKLNLF